MAVLLQLLLFKLVKLSDDGWRSEDEYRPGWLGRGRAGVGGGWSLPVMDRLLRNGCEKGILISRIIQPLPRVSTRTNANTSQPRTSHATPHLTHFASLSALSATLLTSRSSAVMSTLSCFKYEPYWSDRLDRSPVGTAEVDCPCVANGAACGAQVNARDQGGCALRWCVHSGTCV